ncbi:type VI secretion system tip protein VgrG [Chitinophaga rhizosphaerae]|uniref:type VI secretion system tip protein VgrG n=1 Tax=Chitinophaga rhizosphaerae TaxID=1864947 RepID=UPI000F804832|nr:type VI secretion system tip protein VgrG [Chitinophaga rhizosphaerae]
MSDETLLPIEQETSLVTFTVTVNGELVTGDIPILSITVWNEANRIAGATLVVSDGDAALADWPVSAGELFLPGNEIEITAGYHGLEEIIFTGLVASHSLRLRQHSSELQVECRHKSSLLAIGRKSALFKDQKDSEIAATILDAEELTGQIEDTPVTHAEMVQYNATDWDFLITRLDALGFVAVANLDKIDIIKPAVAAEGVATLRFGTNLLEFDGEIDGYLQFGSVKAQSWDPAQQALLEAESTEPEWTTPGDLAAADMGLPLVTLRQPAGLKEEEVQQWADAAALRSRMAFLCGRAQVQGFPSAMPGITVALEGMGPRMNGMAWVSGVRHEIAAGNWTVELQLGMQPEKHAEKFPVQAKPAGALLPGINGLHTAIVKALEGDPDGEGRILLQIPSVDTGDDGVWARVCTLDAGSGRGSCFLPELEDEVLVGFLDDDPRYPVVLGGLHSSAKAAPLEPKDDNHEKGWFTRSGMRILFNDDKKTLVIDTPGGHLVSLDEDAGEVTIKDKNDNKIVLSQDGITIESAKDLVMKASGSIKLESSTGFEAKAGTQFKAEGSAGMEISSSANTVIKGTMVQIN